MWYRTWIDLDAAGAVRGAGYEVRDPDGQRVEINVLPTGPFDSKDEAMGAILADLEHRFGWRQELFGA